MTVKNWILGILVSLFFACGIAGTILVPAVSRTVIRSTTAICSATGLHPLYIVRLLTSLMVVHYLSELPVVLRNARIKWTNSKTLFSRIMGGWSIGVHFAVKLAVPVMFCLIVHGHMLGAGIQTAAA